MEAHSKLAQVATAKKKCEQCKRTKGTDQFTNDHKRPDGFFRVCKTCHRANKHVRDDRLKDFMEGKPEGSVYSMQAYTKEFGMSTKIVERLIADGDLPAVNLCTGKQNHWRIFVPTDRPAEVTESSKEAAGLPEMPDARSGLGANMETAMHLMSKIDRLGGMVDVVGQCFDGAENFALELNQFFAELREVIVNG